MLIDVSERRIPWWVRVLATIFLLAVAATAYAVVSKLIIHGWQEDLHVFDLVLITLFSVLCGYVAVTGRAPFKWFRIVVPFKRK
jgi:hypothetical protein